MKRRIPVHKIHFHFVCYEHENIPLHYSRHGQVNHQLPDELSRRLEKISQQKIQIVWRSVLKSHEKFAAIKFMEIFSHVLLMDDQAQHQCTYRTRLSISYSHPQVASYLEINNVGIMAGVMFFVADFQYSGIAKHNSCS